MNNKMEGRGGMTEGQQKARAEILASASGVGMFGDGGAHVLRGYAGTGKTWLVQKIVQDLQAMGRRVAVTAPTHKAVQVLERKLMDAGVNVATMTIHSAIGLKPSPTDGERTELKKIDDRAPTKADDFDAFVIDESSMVGSDLQKFIDKDLAGRFKLYVGDPAQLPPVGESVAPCFMEGFGRRELMSGVGQSVLTEIVRQEAGNPLLKAAAGLRALQGTGTMDWEWAAQAEDDKGRAGLFHVDREVTDDWMRGAFTSLEFKKDNDAFRYICYTNDRVHAVNAKVRQWIYGETNTPFVPGEKVICRTPINVSGGGAGGGGRGLSKFITLQVFATNEEATVATIKRDVEYFDFEAKMGKGGAVGLKAWTYELPVWRVGLEAKDGRGVVECIVPVDRRDLKALDDKLIAEAKTNRARWMDRFAAMERVSDLRNVYAVTVHSSQGMTVGDAFIDIGDIRKLERRDLLQMQQMLYTAVTRPRFSAMLMV